MDESKSETMEESKIKYSAILAENGYSVNEQYQKGGEFDFHEIYNSDEYSDDFKNYVHEFESVITTMELYEDFISQVSTDSKLINLLNSITDQNELELAKNNLFATDLLFQYKIQNTTSQASQRWKIDWRCAGTIGLGTLAGCQLGPFGCVFGMGFAALTC